MRRKILFIAAVTLAIASKAAKYAQAEGSSEPGSVCTIHPNTSKCNMPSLEGCDCVRT